MDETSNVEQAIRVLTAAGAVVVMDQPHYSVGNAARKLDCSKGWIREHLHEFPNAWRMPGTGGVGELRIPARDIEALAKRQRLLRQQKEAA
jgi:hypothetical protein